MEGVGAGGEMAQTMYAHMNKWINKKEKEKTPHKKRAGGVAQGVGPEFKLQYHKKKQKNFKPFGQLWKEDWPLDQQL
jgi:hypothetical protein